MFSFHISLIAPLLFFYLNPIIAVPEASVTCTAQDPPLRRSSDCAHAIGLMTNTLEPLNPAAFRYGECLVLLRVLYPYAPPLKVDSGLPPPEGLLSLRTRPANLADEVLVFDDILLGGARDSATAVFRYCLRDKPPRLGSILLWHQRGSAKKFYHITLQTVPEDMPMGASRWEKKQRVDGPDDPSCARYHVYYPPRTLSPSGNRASDAGPSSS